MPLTFVFRLISPHGIKSGRVGSIFSSFLQKVVTLQYSKTLGEMKILISIDMYATTCNGTSVSAQRFVAELRRQGHDVRVMSTVGDGTLPVDYPLKVRRIFPFDAIIHKYGFAYARTDRKVMREAIAWCDVVHFMMPFETTYFGKQLADELNKPATAAFHVQPENIASAFNLGNSRFISDMVYRMWRKMVYDRFDYIHCPSRFIRDELVRHGYKSHICPISNGIDKEFVYQKGERVDFPKDKIVVSMVGRLAHEKRQDLLIKAVQMSKYADRIQLVLMGRGPLYNTYRRQAKDLKNPPIFGFYSKEELIRLLGQVDLYVHASDMESEAISCIEAIATGLVPVISDSKLSATSQFALDDRSLFKAGDAADLSRKIDWWIEHPAEKARMERVYADHALQYSLQRSVQQFTQMLEAAIDTHYHVGQSADLRPDDATSLSCS